MEQSVDFPIEMVHVCIYSKICKQCLGRLNFTARSRSCDRVHSKCKVYTLCPASHSTACMYMFQLVEAYDIVERNLDLLGVTAVEDKLQDGVPDTIQSLRLAGIQVSKMEILLTSSSFLGMKVVNTLCFYIVHFCVSLTHYTAIYFH